MAIRSILAPLYTSDSDTIVVDAATKIARKFNAHLEALLLRNPLDVASQFISSRLDVKRYKQLLDEIAHQLDSDERALKAKFEQIISRAEIGISNDSCSNTKPSAAWRVETGDPADVLARCGGAYDLIVAGHPSLSTEASGYSRVLDAIIFNTARPVLLTPQTIAPSVGEVVLVAWNRGIPAGRALLAAHTFLEKAIRVVILTITTQAKLGPEPEDIAKNLEWHGISAEVVRVSPRGKAVANIITDKAGEISADLIVMGAYSQSRVRERVLGGVTKAIMNRSDLPVLMAR